MFDSRPSLRVTPLSHALLAAAFGVLSLFAVERTLRLEARMADDARRQAGRELGQVLRLWEELQLGRIRGAFEVLAADPVGGAPPAWLDGVLVWQPALDPDPTGGSLLRPAPAPVEQAEALLRDPCMQGASALADRALADPALDRVAVARAWAACADGPVPVALLAVSRAADQFLAAELPAEALDALLAVDLPLDPQPDLAQALGLAPGRVVARRLQAAAAWRALGEDDRAAGELLAVGEYIVAQDGAALEQVLPFLAYPVVADLRALGRAAEAARLADASEGARRRLAGYRELVERLRASAAIEGPSLLTVSLPRPGAPGEVVEVPIKTVADPYGQRRYLLAVAALPGGPIVALQIDPAVMLADLVASGPGQPLRVLDAEGRPVLPADAPPAELDAQLPFGRLLPELRLAVVAPEGRAAERRAWRSSQLVPIALLVLMAGIAFVARAAADRQQRELLERQQAFVNRVSHELKTPLAGVKVMAELMEMGVMAERAEVVQASQRIITEVSRMEDRVNAILKGARRAEIQRKEPLDIRRMAEELAEIWAPRFEQKGARLLVQVEDTPPVTGDRELIRDALSNLLDNALKYLREDVAGVVRVRTGVANRWVYYEVTDNGIGVPEHMRRTIFERFVRVEGDGRGKAGGHGLGLAFVAEAVRGHGGKVECREGIAGGARFIIRLRRS